MKKRYHPERDFPSYIFVPGENPHPKKTGGHMEGEDDPVTDPLDPARPFESDFLRYSLDLYNHGYFWEAHVYLESLWNAHKRRGPVADFLKALIKLSAGGVKISIGQAESARGHFERARELIESVMGTEGESFLGFNLKSIISQIDHAIRSQVACFEIHPLWESEYGKKESQNR